VLADMALFARHIHTAEMALFLRVDTRVALERGLRIESGDESILHEAGWDQLCGRKGLRVPPHPVYMGTWISSR
jgi:hypothetical protein